MAKARSELPIRKRFGYIPPSQVKNTRSRRSRSDTQSSIAIASQGEAREGLLRTLQAEPVVTPFPDLSELDFGGGAVLTGSVGKGQSSLDTHSSGALVDAPIPAKRGRPRKVNVEAAPIVEKTELGMVIDQLRVELIEWRMAVAYRVATINRLRAICRFKIVQEMHLSPDVLYAKGEEIKALGVEREHKTMMAESAALYKAMVDTKAEPHPLMPQMMNYVYLATTIAQCDVSEGVIEKKMAGIAKRLPVAKWVESQHGFSLVGLAKIIGYAGDLNRFCEPTTGRIMPSKLWKFMELAVIDGQRQRRVGGEAALEQKYKGHKRSLMWNVGGSLIGGMGRGPRLEPDQEIETAGLHPWPSRFYRHMRFYANRDPELHRKEVGENGKESFSKHAWAMSKRRVEKEFLVSLQIAWRDATRTEMPA